MQGGSSRGGAPVWVIYDPLQHRYFQIDRETKELLSVWREGLTVEELAGLASARLGLLVHLPHVARLIEFVRATGLIVDDRPGSWRELARKASEPRHSLWMQLVHNYLFFKVPLVRPQRFLRATVPLVAPLYSRAAAMMVCAIGLVGLYLASRQWDTFISTFQGFLNLQGALYFGTTLIVVKALHELGHAYTAVRFGCHVPTMGVAFMLMTPLLYTDVTDAWRLSKRRQRVLIDAAGIIVELALACIATLLWVFLPDGFLRSVAFMMATSGWLLSLALNLNPFMRFDGYYLLADAIGVDNMQTRAFAIGTWKVRQILFAPTLEPPEQMPDRLRNGLVVYAWMTWAYRLVLFTGIALVVYYYFFKVLGLMLFAVEIWYFIARPIVGEIMEWRKIGLSAASPSRLAVTTGFAIAAIAALVVPWSYSLEVPAVLEAGDLVQVYPARAAKVVSVDSLRGQQITEGAPIVSFTVPELDKEIETTDIRLELTRKRLARTTEDLLDREEMLVLNRELVSLQTQREGLLRQKQELVVRAPTGGTLLELDRDLKPGQWVAKNDLLALVAARQRQIVRGYVQETDLARVADGARGRFIPDDLTRPSRSVRLVKVAHAGAATIDIAELASVNGGRVPVEPDGNQRLIPVVAQYLVELAEEDGLAAPDQVVRGVVRLDGKAESLLTRAWRQVARVLVRESGF